VSAAARARGCRHRLIAIGQVNAEPTTPAVTVSMNVVLPGLPMPARAQTTALPVGWVGANEARLTAQHRAAEQERD